MKINYNNRRFVAIQNSPNGESSEKTIFHYKQDGQIISASYTGARIIQGNLLGIVNDFSEIDMRYMHVNDRGQIMTGQCKSKPQIGPNGKLQLHETWQWTTGDRSKGSSIIEEI